MQTEPSPMQLRDALVIAKQQFGRGEITIDGLYAAADAYIMSLREYKKRTGKKLSIPSRGYVIRAL